MKRLQVYSAGHFGRPQFVSSGLSVQKVNGRVIARCSLRSFAIPVDNALAREVLGGNWELCPYYNRPAANSQVSSWRWWVAFPLMPDGNMGVQYVCDKCGYAGFNLVKTVVDMQLLHPYEGVLQGNRLMGVIPDDHQAGHINFGFDPTYSQTVNPFWGEGGAKISGQLVSANSAGPGAIFTDRIMALLVPSPRHGRPTSHMLSKGPLRGMQVHQYPSNETGGIAVLTSA